MKTERELFLRYWTDNNLPYDGDDDDMEVAWTAWQASAQREGYKLVPVEPRADLVNHGHQVFLGHFNEGGQTGGRSLYFAYKSMIEAHEISQ